MDDFGDTGPAPQVLSTFKIQITLNSFSISPKISNIIQVAGAMVAAGLLPDLDALGKAEEKEEGAPVFDSTRLEDGFPEEEEEEEEEDFWSLPPKAGSSKLLYMREGSISFFSYFFQITMTFPPISRQLCHCTVHILFFKKKTMNSVCENRMSQIR